MKQVYKLMGLCAIGGAAIGVPIGATIMYFKSKDSTAKILTRVSEVINEINDKYPEEKIILSPSKNVMEGVEFDLAGAISKGMGVEDKPVYMDGKEATINYVNGTTDDAFDATIEAPFSPKETEENNRILSDAEYLPSMARPDRNLARPPIYIITEDDYENGEQLFSKNTLLVNSNFTITTPSGIAINELMYKKIFGDVDIVDYFENLGYEICYIRNRNLKADYIIEMEKDDE